MSNYNIELLTELGKKTGTMQIFINGNKANGILTLLCRSEPFSGDVSADGSCRIQGKIVSLIRELAYVATGKISRDSLTLDMKLDKTSYVLKGIASDDGCTHSKGE